MSLRLALRALPLLALLLAPGVRADDVKTVCTITVNSPDEKETLQRHLPPDRYRFVELVEKGRPDWLASSCRAGVRCDVLVISGHFDDGDAFYTDRLDQRESLPVDELERVACSESCPGVFAQLKEVYLFGCNTLNALPRRSASPEMERSLVRAGHTPAEAGAIARALAERHAESNRDRMRHVFKDVPTIYGFSGKAPLGRYAGPMLDRYLAAGGVGEVASGRPSPSLLGTFSKVGMVALPGLADGDPTAGVRRDACNLRDERLATAAQAAFVHELLRRPSAEVRMFLDGIERWSASLAEDARADAASAAALAAITADAEARDRFLAFARDADEPAVRVRMVALARRLGWVADADARADFARMVVERADRRVLGDVDVELACRRGADPAVVAEIERQAGPARRDAVALSAVRACLGSADGHADVLRAMVAGSGSDVALAQVYLRHRPIADPGELRTVATGVARRNAGDAQVRALDALAAHRLSDPESLAALAKLFPQAGSLEAQRAIAGILIRADTGALARGDLAKSLKRTRLRSPDGVDMIDVLIRRLEASS
jgi:hypothetical protein